MIYGKETPRIFTPPLRELTPDTSMGFEVADFATDVLEMKLIPWQRWLLIHALEVVDDPVDIWRLRYRNVQVLVGRQNGKTTLSCVLALYFLYQLEVGLILGTAQDVSNAEDVWQHVVDEVLQFDHRLGGDVRRRRGQEPCRRSRRKLRRPAGDAP